MLKVNALWAGLDHPAKEEGGKVFEALQSKSDSRIAPLLKGALRCACGKQDFICRDKNLVRQMKETQ